MTLPRLPHILAAAVLLTAGCGSDLPAPRPAANAGSQTLPPRAAPELPPCPSVGEPVETPEGLTLPPGAVTLEAATDGPLTTARGFVPLEPVDVHAFYDDHPGLELVTLEEEGFEAEVLYGGDDLRVYVKARIACTGGSAFSAVVGRRGDAVPVPTGSPVPADR